MAEKIWDKLGYAVLVGLVIGQIFIGFNFKVGQLVYIMTDILILARDFALRRPKSDKIKNGVLTVLACSVFIVNMVA